MSIGVIAGTFALWAVVHSILASQWLKAWARRRFGPGTARWYRVAYVILAVVTLTPVFAASQLLPDRALYTVPMPWRWLMTLGRVVSLGALAISVYQAGLLHFVGLAQLTARDPDRTGVLQVRGIYRYVRHPLYLFSALLIWLTPAMSQNAAGLYAAMTLYFIVGSYHEESLLVDEFGEAYVRYAAQVPRFVPVPGRKFGGE